MAYETIHNSALFYTLQGFEQVYAPWVVDEKISDITRPSDRRNFHVQDKVLVASGEQSFIQMIKDGKLQPNKGYFTVTPCFRDEKEDALHQVGFMKTELIYYEKYTENESQMERMHRQKDEILEICRIFFEMYLPGKIRIDVNDTGALDLITSEKNIELGSYGVRHHDGIIWVYATGCAEPRLTYAVEQEMGIVGYHEALIPKVKFSGDSVLKIVEEYNEFIDAHKQGSKVMELVELSDLLGAIEKYVDTQYKMTLTDLVKFSGITKRAFCNGKRV